MNPSSSANCKAPRADDEHVIGLFHHGFGDERRVLDFLYRGYGAGAVGGTVHHRGVEFDDAVFIRQAAVADRIVVWVVFHFGDDGESGVEGIAAGFQDGHAVVEMADAIGRGNDDRAKIRRGRWARGEDSRRRCRARGAE